MLQCRAQVGLLGSEDLLEKGLWPLQSTLYRKIPWTEQELAATAHSPRGLKRQTRLSVNTYSIVGNFRAYLICDYFVVYIY